MMVFNKDEETKEKVNNVVENKGATEEEEKHENSNTYYVIIDDIFNNCNGDVEKSCEAMLGNIELGNKKINININFY
jgi:hypothetical protein